jgi:5-formyltetrahydrofolate cyclo-ligase
VAERREKDGLIAERLFSLDEFARAKVLLIYASMDDEIETDAIAREALSRGKKLCYPITDRTRREIVLSLVKDIESDFVCGILGIREPRERLAIATSEVEMAIIPGRAFDLEGNRVGRGGGYYDRLLASGEFSATRCAAAYDCQVMGHVPHTASDEKVDILITETRILRF